MGRGFCYRTAVKWHDQCFSLQSLSASAIPAELGTRVAAFHAITQWRLPPLLFRTSGAGYQGFIMRMTVYDTPILSQVGYGLAWIILKLAGWKLEGRPPEESKYVLIAVPHTTNWDFPITMSMAVIFRFKIFWMGKQSLFRGPMGPLMRWMGGIAINRSRSNNMVEQVIETFNKNDELVVTIPPEGTRSKVDKWKTGFYHIAHGAGVPIALGFVDYTTKTGGFGPTFYPTGDIDADIIEIKRIYADMKEKRRQQHQS
ncbi:lysophospholipid acyltransferase family protein [Aestuariirhabdus sp. Z084]|uniref:lysophospholipid acyltransferase family protein n=1 Tax=Aestuariirhabdus haliotis TaxID=2918751 RepID=UPI00201B436E|nr:lysophospholipid acyltransferase family protein [Aestuariirhabdus haliotis]MCL6416859.1 lysophospholipid acyltransferase family protein [Aestuariirhabdus haliotis]MCL6420865.1 lysophospholipid acyltransferase family protein [Aestuariirhabdus haliotis]